MLLFRNIRSSSNAFWWSMICFERWLNSWSPSLLPFTLFELISDKRDWILSSISLKLFITESIFCGSSFSATSRANFFSVLGSSLTSFISYSKITKNLRGGRPLLTVSIEILALYNIIIYIIYIYNIYMFYTDVWPLDCYITGW